MTNDLDAIQARDSERKRMLERFDALVTYSHMQTDDSPVEIPYEVAMAVRAELRAQLARSACKWVRLEGRRGNADYYSTPCRVVNVLYDQPPRFCPDCGGKVEVVAPVEVKA